ncbi:hypothetical protein CcaverHIS002_0108000 [Cutaneotrichosporon cavernicola]|uniref:PH domain-containing protein n=1 Tax=Cutaneotrichosporon cavernicola TaxID=279322 RepID=A0AA48I2A1_9TREE|nr:uncharacterized protein CcaverHIS019_0107950 [Cutaneotrichosporon cavernicola]BEI80271.1 hypothetical protein CcaverHIS002_0108000 [Cutaneotrichosporon cavernicola]BEI88077.1 hypothetical protein CcaverHIS019_0107950 [Cutaneotrichosporon cavernicola]BEI95848.1 hypothetical protein CcaverHIS631_0107970 [Cutaneotrichosporon cavernicola]BEJ03622.1 hypothetical protein CcaverHIS641_0107970 [Cutaneotrichosporon cavernicola]
MAAEGKPLPPPPIESEMDAPHGHAAHTSDRLSPGSKGHGGTSPVSTNAALYNFKLLEALRSGNGAEVQPYLDELKTAPEGSAGRLLGMAVRVASVPVIKYILNSPSIPSPNLPVNPPSPATALHIASDIGRPEVVELLLNDPRVDDTIRDDKGRSALECSSNPEVSALIEDSRATLQSRFLVLLSSYVSSPLSSVEEGTNMLNFLDKPRAEGLNLNALDERTGTSLLHEAARRRDLRLVELAVKRGADVFVRDRRGRRVQEHDKGADERIKTYLRQFTNQETMVQNKSDGRPPDLKGFLSKWVNYRSGWKTRWFVLENGVLSYYRNREDEEVACRGSIALATARISPSPDGTRFEISSKMTTSVPKIIVKSNLRGEIARWAQAIRLNMEFYSKDRQLQRSGSNAGVDHSDARSTKSSIGPLASLGGPSASGSRGISATLNELPASDQFLHPSLKRTPTSLSGISSKSKSGTRTQNTEVPPVPLLPDRSRRHAPSSRKRDNSPGGNTTASELDKSDSDKDTDDGMSGPETVPHESEFELSMLNLTAQLELTQQLVDSMVVSPDIPDRSSVHGSSSPSRQRQVKEALRQSIATLNGLVQRQHGMTQDRERYYQNRIKRELQTRKLWEENLLAVAEQQAETETQLNEAAKDNEKKRRALRQARSVLAELSLSQPASPGMEGRDPELSILGGAFTAPPATHHPAIGDFAPSFALPPAEEAAPATGASPNLRRSISRRSISNRASVSLGRRASIGQYNRGSIGRRQSISFQDIDHVVAAIDDSEDDDDEFFDAIETGTIPNLKTFDTISNPQGPGSRPATPVHILPAKEAKESPLGQVVAVRQAKKGTVESYLARKSLEPYNHVRHRLPIDDDKRPSVSLWSILKSSIGKDLTKISFPVSFNECTSMLQRMAEDMEYDACLTVAASEQDSLKRLAFVAAFAMSNYSSTIGRIAKPFNPMLSQSFEYAIPNRYRYISEQVSHHPPISACYSEAPTWRYYGEVDAKNKFQGRYFEIRPTGVAHAELVIPKEWVNPADKYPPAGAEYPEGKVLEHYSWKKVITNVSNFIMGNPIIDHYGDMNVTNHRTGETCVLTFKPRTWRGKDAFEIKGSVYDRQGNVAWEIAGRWDSQLIARRAGVGSAPLEVDESVSEDPEYLQLWKNTQKPKAPFNLTPYAVTLNDIPEGLEEYLAPTDCRLRTDQRAFENAEYDRAQLLKSLNEEKQRETRRLRAEGRMQQHEPRWFTAITDQDSGERLWEPKRAGDGEVLFWHEREQQGALPDGEKWAEVDHIFVDDGE